MAAPIQDVRDVSFVLREKVGQLERKIDDLDTKVTVIHQLLTQEKGARWMLMLMIGLGGFIAAKVTAIIQFALGK